MKRILVTIVAASLLIAPVADVGAKQKRITGSFTASARPFLAGWPVPASACQNGVEDVHHVSHRVTAPFSGWLEVEMSFSGDWDLLLYEAGGDWLAWSEDQDFTGEPQERLRYYLRKGAAVDIRACNVQSTTDAAVEYSLVAGPAWSVGPGKARVRSVVELSYTLPALATPQAWIYCLSGMGLGCAGTSLIGPRDRFVSVRVDDDAGQEVSADFYQYIGSTYLQVDRFCSSSSEPIALKPGVDFVGVALYAGPCVDGTPALATKGLITLEFSNRR